VDLWFDDSHILDGPGRYKRLIGRLIYLTVTRTNITFVVGVLNRFTHQPKETHWLAAIRVLIYIKSCPRKVLCIENISMAHFWILGSGYASDRGDRKSTKYCTFIGRNLVTWRSKK